MNTQTLDEICIARGTDKATKHPTIRGHGYAPIYDSLFTPLRHLPIKLLEIGVGGGESILSWLDYFEVAEIFGIDLVEKTNEWNTPGKETNLRYTFHQGNQIDRTMFKCWLADCGPTVDIVIDDGSHMADGMITAFECLWPALEKGGIYCVEDLHVASTPGTVFVPEGWPNHLDWIRDKMKEMNNGSDIESLTYYPELCVFKKRV